MFGNRFRWKIVLTHVVLALAFATIVTDFDDLVFGWDTQPSDVSLSVTEERGVKAAVLAMCAAASLFTSLIPMGSGRRGKRVQLYTQIVGGFSALAAGWYWLLSEAGGHTSSYLLALVPMTVVLGAVMAISSYLRWVGDRDDQQEEPRLRWFDILGMIGLLLLIAVIFYLMLWLPSRIF